MLKLVFCLVMLICIAATQQVTADGKCYCPCECAAPRPTVSPRPTTSPRPTASPKPTDPSNNSTNNNGGSGNNNNNSTTSTGPRVESGKTALLIGQNELPEYIAYARAFKAPAGGSFYGNIYAPLLGVQMDNYLSYINSTYPGAYMEYGMDAKSMFEYFYGTYSVNKNTAKQWQDILAGTHNTHTNVKSIARALKSYSALKFVMRIDYEVSGNLHANTDPVNWNPTTQNPTFFKQAFCKIASLVKGEGATNVEFVYHPVRGDYLALYPGDSCVDWIGLSIFNNDLVLPASNGVDMYWNNQTGIVDSNLAAAFAWARNTGKKVMISESSVQRPYSNDDTIIQEYFERLMQVITTYNVEMWAYINTDWLALGWPSEWDNSQLETKSEAMQQWWRTNVLDNSRFIHYRN